MKLVIITAAIFGLLVSCNEDSLVEGYNTKNENGGNLIGQWELSHTSGFTNGVETFSIDIVPDCPTKKDYEEFRLDGTGRSYDYDKSCEDKGHDLKWSKSGNIISYGSGGFTEEILLLDKTTLKVKWKSSNTVYYVDTYKKR